ncbi:hypothetical protein TCAL_04521 [Tigriopus californicus]|uniref:PPM-type phosphatase domain-containing protein n=1 Tax=Tigriopus californicus TaxID=6832 RepID=A0A553PD05_TIGCA|nr:uncharacterized protein LOC131876995 [Tigriopus californicus]TRY75567.1 hypothetical protein TCAL_04521 [Tigriopus californicus]|eukprot:TCALIF_04521-PA protein Name:"Similar to Ppm1d Protein phosphatase 1D (Mus musculus)" AED:0.29 eAED:0.30 QI:0/0/0/1/1/1/4/0/687
MSPSIGVNLRVTAHCHQGDRKYMEDVFSVAYQQTDDQQDLEFAFFGIFDGHGGREAALYAKDHLMDSITKQKQFWSEDDESVLKAIREGFLSTQQAMWADLPNWKKTASGMPSTAGTTASVCFIKRGKLFIGHCGDSGIVMGQRDAFNPTKWKAKRLTTDHKPESDEELARIESAGGKVVNKSGVPRVVWYRPRGGHQGPVRRSTPIDEVPFLAVARALGDLWSYNAKDDVFIVSPDPDLHVFELDSLKDRCLVLATDGAWNVLSPEMAVQGVFEAERNNERHMINPQGGHNWINPSKRLVDQALDRWSMCNLRADNTSIVTVMLDPPGPPRAQVLRKLHGLSASQSTGSLSSATSSESLEGAGAAPALPPKPNGVAIISRCPNSKLDGEKQGTNLVGNQRLFNPDTMATRATPPSLLQRKKMFKPLRLGGSSPLNNAFVPSLFKHRLKIQKERAASPPNNDPIISHEGIQPSSSSSVLPSTIPLQRVKNETLNQIQCNDVSSTDRDPCSSPSPPPPLPGRNLDHKFVATKKKVVTDVAASILVKQPRRSIVPEYISDSENLPSSDKCVHTPQKTPKKRPFAQQNNPGGILKNNLGSPISKSRVLRSAQKETNMTRVTRSSGHFSPANNSQTSDNALKRKRRSLDQNLPLQRSSSISTHTRSRQQSCSAIRHLPGSAAKKARILRNK